MFDERVNYLVKQLMSYLNQRLDASRHLCLDETWPSIAVLDYATFELRGISEKTPEQELLLRSSAALIASLIYQSWENILDEVRVDLREDEIVVGARVFGSSDPDERLEIRLEKELAALFERPPVNFSVTEDFSRILEPVDNFLGLFTLGICAGLSPLCTGLFPKRYGVKHLENVKRTLGACSADFYAALYPEEKIGQVAELYLNDLIYPPMMMQEDFPAARAVSGLIGFLKDYGFSEKRRLQFLKNLSYSPDPLFSSAAIVVSSALTPWPVPEWLIALCEGKGRSMALFRPALALARKLLLERDDWIFQSDFGGKDVSEFRKEGLLGFLPSVQLSEERLAQKEDRELTLKLLRSLMRADFQNSVRFADDLIEKDPNDIEVRFQRVYLDILREDNDRAETRIRALMTEPRVEENPKFYYISALIAFMQGGTDYALKQLERAYKLREPGDFKCFEVLNNYAWTLLSLERVEESLIYFDEALKEGFSPLATRLNKRFALDHLGKTAEVKKIEQELIELNPLDRRVFALLCG